jgi:hypothetical protein
MSPGGPRSPEGGLPPPESPGSSPRLDEDIEFEPPSHPPISATAIINAATAILLAMLMSASPVP